MIPAEYAPWVIPLLSGGLGQLAGIAVGYGVLRYRVAKIEQEHSDCVIERKQVEREIHKSLATITSKVNTTAEDVAYIKGRLNGVSK